MDSGELCALAHATKDHKFILVLCSGNQVIARFFSAKVRDVPDISRRRLLRRRHADGVPCWGVWLRTLSRCPSLVANGALILPFHRQKKKKAFALFFLFNKFLSSSLSQVSVCHTHDPHAFLVLLCLQHFTCQTNQLKFVILPRKQSERRWGVLARQAVTSPAK